MIEGRAQCFDVSKLGLSDLKVTIFHPFCRAEDKENQDRSVTQLDQSSKTRQKLNQKICKIGWSYILMPGTVWQILNCMKFTHFIPESEILRSCFEKFVMCITQENLKSTWIYSWRVSCPCCRYEDHSFDKNQDRSVIAVEIQMIFETKPQFGLQKRHW